MTMEYIEFENSLFKELKSLDEEECFDIITLNQAIIRMNLGDESENFLGESFVEKFNDILLKQPQTIFLAEKILKHDLFARVLSEFRASNILIRACQSEEEEAIVYDFPLDSKDSMDTKKTSKFSEKSSDKEKNKKGKSSNYSKKEFEMKKKLIQQLLILDINPYITDAQGRTALMLASKDPTLTFVVEHFVETENDKILQQEDSNGENALFYAVENFEALKLLMNTSININHRNHEKDTVFLKCCKQDALHGAIHVLSKHPGLEVNLLDQNGMTGPLYLAESGNYTLMSLIENSIDRSIINPNTQETIFYILFRKINEMRYQQGRKPGIKFLRMMNYFIEQNYDFNGPMDDARNTPLMFFIMLDDPLSILYLLHQCPNLDLNVKNKYGEDAFSVSLKCLPKKHSIILQMLVKQGSYQYQYFDRFHNSLLILSILTDNHYMFSQCIQHHPDLAQTVNDRKETPLIIAVKLGKMIAVRALLSQNVDVNCKDQEGNTALHYAVITEDDGLVNMLLNAHADPHLKNNKNQSAYEIAQELKNEALLEVFNSPDSPKYYEMKSLKVNHQKYIDSFHHDMIQITQGLRYQPFLNYKDFKRSLIYLYFNGARLYKLYGVQIELYLI